MDPRLVYSSLVAPSLDAFWGRGFESLAMEQFLKKRIIPTLAEPFKVGQYWDKNIRIDFTIALKSGFSYLGETKWTSANKKIIDGFTHKLACFNRDSPVGTGLPSIGSLTEFSSPPGRKCSVKRNFQVNGQMQYAPVFVCADEVSTDLKKSPTCQVYSLSDLL